MTAQDGDRLLDLLPGLYRESDTTDELRRLLAGFEALLLGSGGGPAADAHGLPGLEARITALPALFAPQGGLACGDEADLATPAPFLHWLAQWIGFVPHALFDEADLRRILAGLMPLYGWRGTRKYLVDLLHLCFDGRVKRIEVDDRPGSGFTLGRSRAGLDSRLSTSRPHRFVVSLEQAGHGEIDDALQHRVRAVIDFAKPAHTRFEVHWRQERLV